MIYRSKPVFSSRPWGDSDLNTIYGVDSEEPIGEVWLLSDTANMKTSLESSSSRLNPEDVTEELCGRALPRLPLMVKYISAKEWLSVQVHPDDEFARRIEGEPWGKSECWYFLTNSQVLAGLKKKTETIDIREKDLNHISLNKGDLLALPAGVVHAIGPSSKLIEIQQNSDTTYRLFDWNRGRDLHLDKAIKVIKPSVNPEYCKNMKSFQWKYFSIEKTVTFSGTGICVTIEERPNLYVVINDNVESQMPFLAITLGPFWSEDL